MTWALWKSEQNAIKAHTQFDIEKHVPVKITITQANAGEIGVLSQNLEPGRIYVKDRGYASLSLFQQILEARSSFVCRVKDNSVYECLEDYELTPDALAAGIVFDKKVRLGSNRKTKEQLSVPVRLIAIIFEHRWAIEIFFRFFKHVLGCRHLLSHKQNGIELQTYAAIIACMLIALWTGRKPTLRTYEMLCWYFTGMADEEELLSHIQRLQKIA